MESKASATRFFPNLTYLYICCLFSKRTAPLRISMGDSTLSRPGIIYIPYPQHLTGPCQILALQVWPYLEAIPRSFHYHQITDHHQRHGQDWKPTDHYFNKEPWCPQGQGLHLCVLVCGTASMCISNKMQVKVRLRMAQRDSCYFNKEHRCPTYFN